MSLYGPFIILKGQFKDHTVEIKKEIMEIASDLV